MRDPSSGSSPWGARPSEGSPIRTVQRLSQVWLPELRRRLDATQGQSGIAYRRVAWWLCWLSIVAAGLTLKLLESTVYGFGTVYDDEMMVEMARGFLHGQWSSSWATTGAATLTKPVGYPLFLAGVHIFPWSPVWSAYVLYVIGASLIVWSWFRIRGSRLQATLLLAILIFNPISFTSQNERVYRDLFIMALFTLAVGVSFLLASLLHDWAGERDPRRPRSHFAGWLSRSPTTRWATAYILVAILGLVVGFAAITKETWEWLLPAAVAPLVYPLVQRLRPSRFRPLPVLRAALAGLMFLGCFWSVIRITEQRDESAYHVALLDDLNSGAFARTWKLWASVEAGHPQKYVPITRAMRLAVYRVSPTAARMKPYLESPADSWKKLDCESLLHICGESGPWFEYDLLVASVETGESHSVSQLQTFFRKIADDIARACDRNELHCSSSPVLAVGLPVLHQIPLSTVASDTAVSLWHMLWDELPISFLPSGKPTPAGYQYWSSVVPGMPQLASLGKRVGSVNPYPLLRTIDRIYRILDLAILCVILLGVAIGATLLIGRSRRRVHLDLEAAIVAIFFLVSTVFAMGTLAVFAVALEPTYDRFGLYWTDFAGVAQLCLVFALFSLAPRPGLNATDREIPPRRAMRTSEDIEGPSGLRTLDPQTL